MCAAAGAPILYWGCARAAAGDLSLRVDLRRGDLGSIAVALETESRPGVPLVLSSFVQSPVLHVESIDARRDDAPVAVARDRDEKGFERFTVAASTGPGRLRVAYTVRPGAVEEAPMSGPTGYRFGHFDRVFGLVAARQIVLLPMEPAPPGRVRLLFRLPPGRRLFTPWPAADRSKAPGAGATDPEFELAGPDAASRLVQAVLAEGEFESAESRDERFRVAALAGLPAGDRAAAIRRALDLEEFLATRLGSPARRFDLILVPQESDGASVAITPGPDSMAMSLGGGVPTRWLSIGRAIGRACLADRSENRRLSDGRRWILETLPTFLTVAFSDRAGWRSRQSWYEEFYYTSAGLSLDLRRPGDLGDATDALMREWRGAQILDLLSNDLRAGGGAMIEESLLDLRARGAAPDWDRIVEGWPEAVRRRLDRFLSPSPYPFPFPGTGGAGPPLSLPAPAPIGARADARRLDLYAGGRNLGLLEQCGCRSRQAGGMARRATLLRRRLRGPTPALAFELGDALPFDQQAFSLDQQTIAESDLALSLMAFAGESASVVSHAELTRGPRFLAGRAARLPSGFVFLSANVSAPGLALARSLDRALARTTVRVIGVEDPDSYHLGRPLEFEDAIAPMTIEDPLPPIRDVLEGKTSGNRRAGGRGLTIVAGSLGPTAVLRMHDALPDLPLIVTDDYFRFTQDPRLRFERPLGGKGFSAAGFLGRTLLVVLRTDTYALTRIGLGLRDDGAITGCDLEDMVLDESIPDDPLVRARLDAHYARLAAASGLSEPAPIGTRLYAMIGAGYVGAASCASCHPGETEQWKGTPHASAYATLLSKRRQGVPGCYACHVTGYRQPGGYHAIADVALRHVQCEACHGPGARHVRDPRRDTIVGAPAASVCMECHTEKHSEMTAQNFPDYRARVAHAPAGGSRP